jgi:two-component system, chemotaxis family, chemotaxis protein CheY
MHIDYSAPILIVDDEQVMVALTKKVLSKVGFEQIDHAVDGETALMLLRQKNYRLVIADLRMQPVGGLQILRTIRQDHELKDTRFLLMTASLAPEPVAAAKHGGADAYLLKPFTPRQLRAKLNEVFSRHHQ